MDSGEERRFATWLPIEWVLLALLAASLGILRRTCKHEARWEIRRLDDATGRVSVYYSIEEPRQVPDLSLTFTDIDGTRRTLGGAVKAEQVD